MTEPQTFTFADDGAIPNSKLPLLVYRQAVPADPAAIERLFTANRWPAAWRDAVHPFHHFHSDAHEVLGVASGSAQGALRRSGRAGAGGAAPAMSWWCRRASVTATRARAPIC